MTPIVNGLELEYGEQIAFQYLNVDEPEGSMAARAYRVRGHPTTVLFNSQGDVLWTRVGILPREDIVQAIESAITP